MKRRISLVVVPLAFMAAITPARGEISGAASIEVAVEPNVPDVTAPEVGDPIGEAELRDIEFIADAQGLSLEEAIAQYAWNDNFALLTSRIREGFPADFATAGIVDSDQAFVAFAGSAPIAADQLIQEFAAAFGKVSVDIRSNAGYSEAELVVAIPAAHYAVFQIAGVLDAHTSFDTESQTITTTVVLKSGAAETALHELQASAIAGISAVGIDGLLDRIGVSVVQSSHSVLSGLDSNTEHLGGESITGCTSGFVVGGGGPRGPATAGHCGNTQTDDGAAIGFLSEHQGNHGDFQFHGGNQPRPDDFYAGDANVTEVDRRDVSGVGAPVVGQTMCKNGSTNHKQCQKVRKLNVCTGVYCNLVQLEARLAAPGDSGGSVYFGNTAYGFHHGWHYDVFPFDRDLFSRADRIDDALGVNVATT